MFSEMTKLDMKATRVNEQVIMEVHMTILAQSLVECSLTPRHTFNKLFSISLKQLSTPKMAAHNSSAAPIDIITRVHNPPAELYNKIHDFTFKSNFNKICCIDNDYKPPNILQINRKCRILLSPAFCHCTIFTVMEDDRKDLETFTLSKWIKSLNECGSLIFRTHDCESTTRHLLLSEASKS